MWQFWTCPGITSSSLSPMGGMVVAPTLEQKRHILKNAVDFCRRLGYDRPKAAILCAVENVTDTMPETVDAAQLKRESSSGVFGPCVVEGPISLDLATRPGGRPD